METLVVVNNPKNWPLKVPGVRLVGARAYLTDPFYSQLGHARVINLCRSYSYQNLGYYVSLLAEARRHRVMPDLLCLQDMRSATLTRAVMQDLDELVQKSLANIRSREFTLSIYFGRNLARRHERLSRQLFALFQAPMLRATFRRDEEQWSLKTIRPIPTNELPNKHRPFVVEAATEYLKGGMPRRRLRPRYHIAILHNPEEVQPPSNKGAVRRFLRAARKLGMGAELIEPGDYGRLAEFDALFIRETTNVDHHTYRFSRRAQAEGMVVIDDPVSIVRCTNKVFLAELLLQHKVPAPRTLVTHRDNVDQVEKALGLPCILKEPDSSFSRGVFKVHDAASLKAEVDRLLEDSDLLIAQEFIPTEFDWRIGVLDRRPLYACRYHMAPNHWQIQQRLDDGELSYGMADTLPVWEVPEQVVRTAIKAANLIGDGLYGVDLKEVGDKVYVIEVNDNPSMDAGIEDFVLGEELYLRLMRCFLDRIQRRGAEVS